MSSPEVQQTAEDGAAGDDAVARIRAALDDLGGEQELAELPLTEATARLETLHAELQGALADLDRT